MEISRDPMKRRVVRIAILVLMPLALGVPSLRAQIPGSPAEVLGTVVEVNGKDPIPDAEVLIDGDVLARTDNNGEFTLSVQPGSRLLEVRRIGFAPGYARLELQPNAMVHLEVRLPVRAVQLDTIVIEGKSLRYRDRLYDFYRRQLKWGRGKFYPPEVMEQETLSRMSHFFRRVPGVEVRCVDSFCQDEALLVRGGRCLMELFVDGMRWKPGVGGVNILNPEIVAAVEVYTSASQVPPELSAQAERCGVVAFWTKTGQR